jgi:hypothetical protein
MRRARRSFLAQHSGVSHDIEYEHLDGEPGPTCETRAGFDVDHVETRVRLDFERSCSTSAGSLKNAGA